MTSRKKLTRKENLKAIDLLKLLRKSLVAMNQLREKKMAKKNEELSEGSLHPQKSKEDSDEEEDKTRKKIKAEESSDEDLDTKKREEKKKIKAEESSDEDQDTKKREKERRRRKKEKKH